MTHTAPAVPLDRLGRGDLAAAGGKAANLGELIRLGLDVPDGFAVTTAAYARAAEHCGATELAGTLPAEAGSGGAHGDNGDGSAIRDALTGADIGADLRSALLSAYAGLGSGPVAVRSSATAEDLPGAAFAGQQDTFLNVVGEAALLDAVRRCWASLWTDLAIAYRRRIGIDPGSVRIAVVVQSMVDADHAGVLLTADPVTGDRARLLVDSGRGLGESVVSGLVTPDHYVLDRRGTVLEHRAGRGEVVVLPAAGGGVVHSESGAVGPDEGGALEPRVLADLARLGARVAGHYGRPMDIEWALAGGRVLLLQARPMTAVPPEPLRLNAFQRKAGPVLLDMFQTRPYPLDTTTWTAALLGLVRGMLYGLAGVRIGDDARILPQEDGVVVRFVPPVPRPTPATLVRPFQLLARDLRFDPARWTDDPRFTAFERDLSALDAVDPSAVGWPELRALPSRALALVPALTALRVDYLPGWFLPLVRLRLTLTLLGRGGSTGDLVFGAPTRTEDANRALEDLAERVRADPVLTAAFSGRSAAEVTADLHAGRLPDAFTARFGAFLDEYGHRETASAVYISAPTWKDAPETVVGLIALLASAPPSRAAPTAGPAPTAGDTGPAGGAGPRGGAGRAGAAVDRLLRHPLLRRPGPRRRMLRLIGRVRAGTALREDTHFHFTRIMPALRGALIETGRRLTAEGILRAPEDVFHLTRAELEGIDRLPGVPADQADRLRSAVLLRSAKRDELTGVRMLDLHASGAARAPDGDALAAGTPACGGTATGPVRVITDSAGFDRMRDGDVLVCPYTNPSWTPLFQRAAAVVADSGGIGSHAAIVAREYGVPAVMGTGNATEVLTDGDRVTVDGDTGQVRAAPDAP